MKTNQTRIQNQTGNPLEHREIGELIAEIDSGKWDLGIDVDDEGETRRVAVQIFQREISAERPGTALDQMTFEGDSIPEALAMAVNAIRRLCGKPSLEEEVEAMLAADEASANIIQEWGHRACCVACGSSEPLKLQRQVDFMVSWDNGEVDFHGDPKGNASGQELRAMFLYPLEAAEVFTCRHCGKPYKLAGS